MTDQTSPQTRAALDALILNFGKKVSEANSPDDDPAYEAAKALSRFLDGHILMTPDEYAYRKALDPALRPYTCQSFQGVWLGGTAVVVAADKAAARDLLATKLEAKNLKLHKDDKIVELDLTAPGATILDNGDY